jgi:hypothetical protein
LIGSWNALRRSAGLVNRSATAPPPGRRGAGSTADPTCSTVVHGLLEGPSTSTSHKGSSLDPLPPGGFKHKRVRYLDIHEDEELDEKLIASWIRQAAELPGEDLF